jgi:pyoverdine/dityrosine biosynthesis protein Dit1
MKNIQCDSTRNRNHQPKNALAIAKRILAEILQFRRSTNTNDSCRDINCTLCASFHLPKITFAIQNHQPVTFVLPAFPGKSPNPEKVLGPLTDHAERLSLHFLGMLCQRIKHYYFPGIKIILCSDGRVFSDVVGMKEADVTVYQVELNKLIKRMSLSDLSIFNLDDFYHQSNFQQMRTELMQRYGTSLECTQQKIRNGAHASATSDEQEANRMYCGITRFLFEDAQYSGQTKSRAALQKEARTKAYEMIRRSNAWSELIAERFPDSVRLSIHPQHCGSRKLGIRLIKNEIWMTPWHGVVVETTSGYVLLKRSQAEALGAQLIYSADGCPSHYQLRNSI